MTAKVLRRFPRAERDQAHAFQADARAGTDPNATCTETADEVLVWDAQPTVEEVDATHAPRGDA